MLYALFLLAFSVFQAQADITISQISGYQDIKNYVPGGINSTLMIAGNDPSQTLEITFSSSAQTGTPTILIATQNAYMTPIVQTEAPVITTAPNQTTSLKVTWSELCGLLPSADPTCSTPDVGTFWIGLGQDLLGFTVRIDKKIP